MSDTLQLHLLEQELLQQDSPGARLGWEPGRAAGGGCWEESGELRDPEAG